MEAGHSFCGGWVGEQQLRTYPSKGCPETIDKSRIVKSAPTYGDPVRHTTKILIKNSNLDNFSLLLKRNVDRKVSINGTHFVTEAFSHSLKKQKFDCSLIKKTNLNHIHNMRTNCSDSSQFLSNSKPFANTKYISSFLCYFNIEMTKIACKRSTRSSHFDKSVLNRKLYAFWKLDSVA
uniref:Uncharacterized protein n=1 Tax=Meloidogyne incognita TaxID=6306 RepID=A0A914KUL7_MELIC